MGLYAIIMLLNMGLKSAEKELPFKLDDDPEFDLGITSGKFSRPQREMYRRGDELGDVIHIPRFYEPIIDDGVIDGDMSPAKTLVTEAEFMAVFAEQDGNLRNTAKRLDMTTQTAANYARMWGLPVGPRGKRSTLTALLPGIAADREAGMNGAQLEEKYHVPRNTIRQSLWRQKNKK